MKKEKEKEKEMTSREKMQQETRIIAYLLHNPKIMEEMNAVQIAKSTQSKESIVRDVLNGEIKPKGTKAQEKLLDINYTIIEKGKAIINENIDRIDITKMSDLKYLSDILESAFKQNRLLQGQSTENAMIGVADIYDAIIVNADKKKEAQ